MSTSRRTPSWVVKEYKELSCSHKSVWGYFGEGENPYYAFLENSDIILVSEDSANMLTEAASVGNKGFPLLQNIPRLICDCSLILCTP
ncbi:MAG: ELM1/GtrOC1 family putative glycosyltransferase [Hellea sp.]|nr:ELM1/GtrOC1 family putative glycosyltransferase [Hellea sp.]